MGKVALLGLALALAVAPAASARLPNPCALLTTAEIAKAFGEKVEDRTASRANSSCTWSGRPLSNFTSAHPEVTLSVAQITKAQFKASAVQIIPGATLGTMQRLPAQPINGVGQHAYSMLNGNDLIVWYRGTALDISTATISTPLETAKRLAKDAITRL